MKFFYSIHFLLPFVLIVLILGHILLLHVNGSRATLNRAVKISFLPYYLFKDLVNLGVVALRFVRILLVPYLAGDPENFSPANPAVSPLHIKPEWYFLQYYAILRAIPNKVGGVIFFAGALLALGALALKKVDYKLELFPL